MLYVKFAPQKSGGLNDLPYRLARQLLNFRVGAHAASIRSGGVSGKLPGECLSPDWSHPNTGLAKIRRCFRLLGVVVLVTSE